MRKILLSFLITLNCLSFSYANNIDLLYNSICIEQLPKNLNNSNLSNKLVSNCKKNVYNNVISQYPKYLINNSIPLLNYKYCDNPKYYVYKVNLQYIDLPSNKNKNNTFVMSTESQLDNKSFDEAASTSFEKNSKSYKNLIITHSVQPVNNSFYQKTYELYVSCRINLSKILLNKKLSINNNF